MTHIVHATIPVRRSAALLGAILCAAALSLPGAAVAGSGQEVSGPSPSADCQGKPCPDTSGGKGSGGPATDTTGGTEGTFADFER
ncbi:hypothetical protein [Roseospira navarrensis]|uniref:Uncharacterized protein n=1 Tax=Roseospira navarrensis TaxID=140058 RepID=A0A7X1ZHK6_9PROT|nr:hypothetical protein [Roseospira navarrensis]MQX38517.1 hypothetical protein [Roseospira navarrensis]